MKTIHIVQTAFGPYELSSFEIYAFHYVYGVRWETEIVAYAEAMMEKSFS